LAAPLMARPVPCRVVSHRETGHMTLPWPVRRPERGVAIDAKGGRDSFHAVDYAARTASELFPQPAKRDGFPEAYQGEFSPRQAIESVVRSAGRSLLLVSGGEHAGQEAMLEKARESME